jgi:hypothetical protein
VRVRGSVAAQLPADRSDLGRVAARHRQAGQTADTELEGEPRYIVLCRARRGGDVVVVAAAALLCCQTFRQRITAHHRRCM